MEAMRTILLALCIMISTSVRAQSSAALFAKHLNYSVRINKLSPADFLDWIITDEHTSKPSGVHHIYVRQRYRQIQISSGTASIHLLPNGELLHLNNQFVANLSEKVNATNPRLSAVQAATAASRQLGYTVSGPLQMLARAKGAEQATKLNKGGISLEPIPVKLVYHQIENGQLHLAWELSIYELGGQHYWQVWVDAVTGEVLAKNDLVEHCTFDLPKATVPVSMLREERTDGLSDLIISPVTGAAYNVFPVPVESPNHGSRELLIDPFDPTASPFGWHDIDGLPGAEYTITRGNNVYAYEDTDGNNIPGYSPDGGPQLYFDFPLDLSKSPQGYQDAGITNLFYWNNTLHDILYRYGFDEASGNFQTNNYGRGGLGNDAVRAEAQDGGATNNANFFTPLDGEKPRMQMYLYTPPRIGLFQVNAPVDIAGTYLNNVAAFGAPSFNVTGFLAEVNDGSAEPSLGCESLVNVEEIAGKIALIDRGDCEFGVKALNAENAGAIAVVICNYEPDVLVMSPASVGDQVTIPLMMLGSEDCQTIRASISDPGVQVTMQYDPIPSDSLDGDLDNGVIAHEYVHGLSNRLTGGSSSFCLFGEERMGEGWSDWYALMLTMKAEDMAVEGRGIATYLIREPITGTGIRSYPYSTDRTLNPLTYDSIITARVPHGVGTVWGTMLWEISWSLIDRYGFDPDLFSGTGGNNRALQLVTEALKMQPCNPGFVDGREALLAADEVLYNGSHRRLIWEAFAKRGLGFSADQGSSSSRSDGTEAFDLPPDLISDETCDGEFIVIDTDPEDLEVIAAAQTITTSGSVFISFDQEVIFQAGQSINLRAGFRATGKFTAKIEACENTLTNEPAEIKSLANAAEGPLAQSSAGKLQLKLVPNPSRGLTTMHYELPLAGKVTMAVYDLQGKPVRSLLLRSEQQAGRHQLEWYADEVPSGIYLVRIQTETATEVKKLMIVR